MQELPTQKGFDSIMSSVCTHGKDIINPYTNQHMYIPCGKCPACLLKKSSMASIKCEFQDRITSLSKFLNHKSDTQFYVSDKPPCIVCRKDFQHIPLFDNGIPFDF
jgi:hypothetical protein